MDEKKIKALYTRFVRNKYFYRTFSREYLSRIKKEGFNPLKNPYESQKDNIIHFCKMLDRLEKQGYSYVYSCWPRSKPIGSIISRVFRKSLRKQYIDLTPNDFNDLQYYKSRKGGDIPVTVNHIAKDLIKWKYPLTAKDRAVIKKLLLWSEKKMRFSNITIRIKATSKYLEKAHLQRFYGQPYLPSPFGSFKHFSKNITKYGYKVYRPYLLGTEQYYLRFQKAIPSAEFEFC